MSKIDPSVILKRVIWMQRVQDLVRTGHRYHVSGQCDLERLPDLYDKFSGCMTLTRQRCRPPVCAGRVGALRSS